MPFLDIATAKPSLQNYLAPLRVQTFLHGQVLSGQWKPSQFSKRVIFHVGHPRTQGGKLQIKAIATLEPKCSVQKGNGKNNSKLVVGSSPLATHLESSKEVVERERLRRMRISKANKGNTPWNKGRKHSAETLQRIRERTRLAMQDPKVKMKLVNLGHAQSNETRAKIGIGVRMGWERRREKLMLQEMCHFEWQNLIAEASRRGFVGEEELQWDSYKILDQQLKKEWLESVEQRKSLPRPKGSKRAPKSMEQRRKIAEAIAAKWADPEYRDRVCSGLAKYHGTAGAERKQRKRNGVTSSTNRSPTKRKANDTAKSSIKENKHPIERIRVRRCNKPLYKDPLAKSKLEMIKNIRAERAAAESKKTEAIERARLLIAEAEKAAKALEVAAERSPVAQASLWETRKLIAEAIQSIESIEGSQVTSNENDKHLSVDSTEIVGQVQKEMEPENNGSGEADRREVNGNQNLPLSNNEDFTFAKFTLQRIVNGEDEFMPSSSSTYGSPTFNLERLIQLSDSSEQLDQSVPNGVNNDEQNPLPNGAKFQVKEDEASPKPVTVTKKWVRGRLVEVLEGVS